MRNKNTFANFPFPKAPTDLSNTIIMFITKVLSLLCRVNLIYKLAISVYLGLHGLDFLEFIRVNYIHVLLDQPFFPVDEMTDLFALVSGKVQCWLIQTYW